MIALFLISLNVMAQINFEPIYNYNLEDKEVLKVSTSLINEMVNSSCFEKVFLERNLRKTNGRTNKEVIEHLRSIKGSVPLHMYYTRKSVVGYRQPPKPDVYTNSKFHRGASACSRASNLAHEALGHSLGDYGHAFRPNKLRPYTVPYSLNYAFEKCCACNGVTDCFILEKPVTEKTKTVCRRTWRTLWLRKTCYRVTM